MSAPDAIPAAFAIPAASLAWLGVLWPTIVTRIPLSWRERFTPHKWVRVPLSEGYARECVRHLHRPRYYNAHGVRLCDARLALPSPSDAGMRPYPLAELFPAPLACDLYHGHPFPHFNIRANRTWR